MKKAIFEEQTAKALKKWQKVAKDKRKLMRKAGVDVPSGTMSGEATPSQGTSPIHLLHKYKPNQTDTDSVLYSPRSYQSETDLSDTELSSHQLNEITQTRQAPRNGEPHNVDFSFVSFN